MKKVIGIDLGTTNSVIGFKDLRTRILESPQDGELIKSVVTQKDGQFLVGKNAVSYAKIDLPNVIFSVKRLMGMGMKDKMVQQMIEEAARTRSFYGYSIDSLQGGTDDAVAIVMHGVQYTPEQISGEILKYIKDKASELLDDQITHAVITVPAYFTEKQKNATKLAAKYAGLKVLRLLAEPTAAAIAYGVDELKPGEAKTVLIYDFGGGTFDLSVLTIADGQYLEMGTGGDRWLGGDDIDQALSSYIYDRVCSEFDIAPDSIDGLIENLPERTRYKFKSAFKKKVERLKINLGVMARDDFQLEDMLEDEDGDTIDIYLTIKREEFEDVVRPIIAKSIDIMKRFLDGINYDMDLIDHILMVGGTSSIPLIKDMLEEAFGTGKVLKSNNPMLDVARGAAILAHRLDDNYEPVPDAVENVVHDVAYSANHNMYIMLDDGECGLKPERIIEVQTPLPQETIKRFRTTADNQKIIKIEIRSDEENGKLSDSGSVAFVSLDRDMPRGSEIIFEFRLSIDETMDLLVYPQGEKSKMKQVHITRGNFDAKAFTTIDEEINRFNSGDYSVAKRQDFEKAITDKIKIAEQIPLGDSMSSDWAKITYETKEAGESIRGRTEQEKDFDYRIFGAILVNNYEEFVRDADLEAIRSLISTINDDDSPMRSVAAQSQLEKITDKYGLFFNIFFLKMAADEAAKSNPRDQSQLNDYHERVLEKVRAVDIDSAMEIHEEGMLLANKYIDADSLGTISTSIGR
jgi:molecular chaperone DnaK